MTAIDINPVLLELIPAQNLTIRQMDVRTSSGQLPANAYDLISCRALLHQISEYAPTVLARMAYALKPGGWLLVQEPDFLIGRELPSMVSKLGLGQPQAKTDVQNIRGRDRGALYFQLFFAEVRDRVVNSGRLDAATLDAASALLEDPNYWTQCWMMTAVWVRKAPA